MIFGVISMITLLALLVAAVVPRNRALPPPSQR